MAGRSLLLIWWMMVLPFEIKGGDLGEKAYDFSCIFIGLDVFELLSQVEMFRRYLQLVA